MATNKKSPMGRVLLAGMACAWLAGCTPSAPELVQQGERLQRDGKFADAIPKYEAARALMPQSALIWNQLGLAYHHVGRINDAVQAYRQALQLDRNLVAARFNLGNLHLEQTNLTAALNELTAFVSLQPNNADGWIRLGAAHSRARRFDDAERCLSQAARMVPKHPEPMNGLGVVQWQRRRYRDAAAYFDSAVRLSPNYPPALLNLAILNHLYLNNRPVALEKYRAYLAIQPQQANWAAVNDTAHALDLELHPPAKPVPVLTQTAPVMQPTQVVNTVAVSIPPVKTSTPPVAVALATNRSTNVVAKVAAPATQPLGLPAVTRKVEVVQLPDEPAIKPAQQPKTTPPPAPVQTASVSTPTPEAPPSSGRIEMPPTKPEKRGFFQKLNPVRWFGSDSPKTNRVSAPVQYTTNSRVVAKNVDGPIVTAPSETAPALVASTTPLPAVPEVKSTPYQYQRPPAPAFGNREEADKYFAAGLKAHQGGKLTAAVTEYLAATQADPSYFEAYYNLGLAAYDLDHLVRSLSAYEMALSIKPTDVNARYNFALALRKAGHPRDAAKELETLLSENPNEARAHLALGNLYAQQLFLTQKAREHYLKVLSLDPRNAQAADIRYWLSAHP